MTENDDSGPDLTSHGMLERHRKNIKKGASDALVPVEELQVLVEEWKAKAFENGSDLYAEGVCECADDLQERIEKYE